MQSDIINTTNISNQSNQIHLSNEKLLEKKNEIQLNPNHKISPNQITNANFLLNNPLPTPLEDNNLILHPPFLSGYLKPPLICLTKIDSTGYKNSVLQCLSQTAELTKYFLKESNKEKILNDNNSISNKNEIKLCPVYYDLIQSLWKKDASYKSFSSDNFIKTLETILKNEQDKITPGGPGETKDFIIFILEMIHNELKRPLDKKLSFGQFNPENELNCYDQKSVFNHFFDKFQNETSIISDIFFGVNELTNICLNCKNNGQKECICYSYEIFNILIFPLEEIRKNQEKFNKDNNPNIITLIDCFYYNQKSEYFTGENKNYCNICRQIFDTDKTSKIFVAPNVLILLFKREKETVSDIRIDFPFQLDISDFVLRKEKNEIYNLYGIISNIDKTKQNEHFVAICKNPVDNNWYMYNDEIIKPIYNNLKDINDFGSPYILFYQKIIEIKN